MSERPLRYEPLDVWQATVGAWANGVFPDSTPESIANHLSEEVGELLEAIFTKSDAREEAADCLLLLLHLAHKLGFSLADAAGVKLAINHIRTWETEAGEKGYWKHVEEGVEP